VASNAKRGEVEGSTYGKSSRLLQGGRRRGLRKRNRNYRRIVETEKHEWRKKGRAEKTDSEPSGKHVPFIKGCRIGGTKFVNRQEGENSPNREGTRGVRGRWGETRVFSKLRPCAQ